MTTSRFASPAVKKTADTNYLASAPTLVNLSHLTLQSTLADLPMHQFSVSVQTAGEVVAQAFQGQPDLPGVIIMAGEDVVTAVSRRRFLEHIGRAFGLEVYLNRPMKVLVNTIGTNHLTFASDTKIQEAAAAALTRPSDLYNEPVVVRVGEHDLRLLDSYILLLAQTELLKQVNQLEQNRQQLAESLRKTGQVLVSSLSLKKVTKRILKELDKVVAFERGAVLLREDEQLSLIAKRGFPRDERVKELVVPYQADSEDVFGRMLQSQRPLLVPDVTQEPGWTQLDWLPLNRSWLGVPLITQDKVIGMISLTRLEADAFTENDVAVVLTFASQAAIALENARLYEKILSFNDQLEQNVAERTEELNRAYTILEKLDQTKSDFIKVSAHELRTPITVIKGYAQVLSTVPALKEDESSELMLAGILSGVTRMHRVVNSMLDVAKIDSNTLEVVHEELYLMDIFQKLSGSLAENVRQRRLSLSLDTSLEGLTAVTGDPNLLEKLFFALLTNAIKYTPDGGQIVVSGKEIPPAATAPAWVEITVADSGIGVNPDQHELIFEKFYQTGELDLHSSGLTKFMGGGPGLGLAIARGIVEAHEGDIWVESHGRDQKTFPGSKFIVRLPVS